MFDIAIVGAGVAGLCAAYCADDVARMDVCLIDSLKQTGGQCSVLYPTKNVYGVPGFSGMKAFDFVERLRGRIFESSDNVFLGHRVEKISKRQDGCFLLKIKNTEISDIEKNIKNQDIKTKSSQQESSCVSSRYVIIATGIGNMSPNFPSDIAGFDSVERCSDFVQYYCDNAGKSYAGKKIVIAGGGDSAVDFALEVADTADKIFILHRRNRLTCEDFKLEILQKFVDSGKLEIKLETKITAISEEGPNRFVQTKLQTYSIDHIVFCYGFSASSGIINGLEELGVKLNMNAIHVDVNTMQTAVQNCYAIGDAVQYPNKKKNIVPCFFEADRAVRMIKEDMRKMMS